MGECCPAPRLLVAGDEYKLQSEEAVVAEVVGLAAAVLLWGVAFTVFAQPVGRGNRRPVSIFVQHFVLDVKDSAVVPKSCSAFAKLLRL